MKTSQNETRITSFGRRFLVAVLAVSAFAATANAEKLPDDNQNVRAGSRAQIVYTASKHDDLQSEGPDRQPVLIAQLQEWCYTSNGAYPMAVWMPIGSSCRVNVGPYVLYGTVGF